MAKVRRSVLKHCECLALTFCVLCLILVLRGYSIPVDSIRGDRLIHPPDSHMGGYNITGHRIFLSLDPPLRVVKSMTTDIQPAGPNSTLTLSGDLVPMRSPCSVQSTHINCDCCLGSMAILFKLLGRPTEM